MKSTGALHKQDLMNLSTAKNFEGFLKNYCSSAFSNKLEKGGKALKKAILYCLFPAPSRFRPRLCFATAKLFNQKPESVFPLAASIEMIHCGSLAQDDLPAMDNSNTRRNRPACHIKFGEDLALLAGSTLFVEAFLLISSYKLPQNKTQSLLRLVTQKAGFQGLMQGQAMDLLKSSPSRGFFLNMYRLKTGALIEASVQGTALLWGNAAQKSPLRHFARALAVAYQIADDLEDGDSTPLSSKKELEGWTDRAILHLKPLGPKALSLKKLALLNKKRVF